MLDDQRALAGNGQIEGGKLSGDAAAVIRQSRRRAQPADVAVADANGTRPWPLGADAEAVAEERAAALGRALDVDGFRAGEDQVFLQGERLNGLDDVIGEDWPRRR